MQGTNLDHAGKEGMVQRSALAIMRNLSVVPKARYKLTASYCALSAGVDGVMLDLLSPNSMSTSLRDVAATSAMASLAQAPLDTVEAIYNVSHVHALLVCQAGCYDWSSRGLRRQGG